MPDPLINRRLGRYQVHQEIGHGGMARVYRATDTLLQRPVALKILAPQMGDDPAVAQRFEREAITAANLRHPAIITIFDVGQTDGLNYIAMEYVAGRTLQDAIVERGKLGLALTIGVLAPVAAALHYAHQQGAVHRDVKPHNILIDTDGRVLLTDFGIALGPQQGNERLTRVGTFVGTPEYLSPEQVQAQPLTGRSDLYALAVVAFEALTGRVPFEGATPQLLMAHVYTPPPPIRSVNPELPPDLEPIFERALAKDPAARFPDANAFVEALRAAALRHGVTPARQEEIAALAVPAGSSAGQATVALQTPPDRGASAPTADPSAATFPMAEVSAAPPPAPAPTTLSPRASSPARPQPPVPPPPLTPAQGGARPSSWRRTPRRLVYPQGEDGGGFGVPPPRRGMYGGEGGGGLHWSVVAIGMVAVLLAGLFVYRAFRPAPGAAGEATDLSMVFAASPTPSDTPSPVAVASTAAPPGDIPTPAPTAVPVGSPPPAPTEPLPPTAGPTALPTGVPSPAIAASPTAPPTIAASPTTGQTSTPSRTVEPTATGTPTAIPPTPTPVGGGGAIAFQSGSALALLDAAASTTTPITDEIQAAGPVAISPDGRTILFDTLTGDDRQIFQFDREARSITPLIQEDGEEYHPAWSPDGRRVVFSSTRDGNPEIYVVDLETGLTERWTNDPAEDDYPSFSPDGSAIIWASSSGEDWRILIDNREGQRRVVEPVPGIDDRYPRISPNGSQVAFASNRGRADGGLEIYVQDLAGGTPRRLTHFNQGSASGPQWSPDGQMIVFFSDVKGGNDIYTVRVSDGVVSTIRETPEDERWPVWGR